MPHDALESRSDAFSPLINRLEETRIGGHRRAAGYRPARRVGELGGLSNVKTVEQRLYA